MIETIRSSDNNEIPFAGRQALFARLQQQILDPPHRHALVFSGHDGIGKTAFLNQCPDVFDENFLLILTPLSETNFADTEALLGSLYDAINEQLNEKNFSLSRVPEMDETADTSFPDWFRDVYLPEVISIIRPNRRIVWMIDDANELLKFGSDFFQYLHDLLIAQSQFRIILTFNTDYEAQFSEFSPLINPILVERIHRLNQDESVDLIRQYAPGLEDEFIEKIVIASGGHPRLVARFGRSVQNHRLNNADGEAFKLAEKEVYQLSQSDFRKLWLKLSRDERLVLTAIASLIYKNPLQTVTAVRIETWLVETDYLLDIVGINAALRGLDYQDIVSHRQHDGIKLTTGLIQQWLLEQARLDIEENTVQRGQLPLRLIVIALIVIVIIVLLLVFIPPQYLDTSGVPTATLDS